MGLFVMRLIGVRVENDLTEIEKKFLAAKFLSGSARIIAGYILSDAGVRFIKNSAFRRLERARSAPMRASVWAPPTAADKNRIESAVVVVVGFSFHVPPNPPKCHYSSLLDSKVAFSTFDQTG